MGQSWITLVQSADFIAENGLGCLSPICGTTAGGRGARTSKMSLS